MKNLFTASFESSARSSESDTPLFTIVQEVSHDLRSIFSVISGLHSLLPLTSNEQQRDEMFRRLHHNTEHATHLFTDLEDFCKLSTEQVSATEDRFSPTIMLAQIRKRMQSVLARHQVNLQVHTGNDYEVSGDEDKVQRIIRNIINHLIYTCRVSEISLDWANGDAYWQVAIHYQGTPLPRWLFEADRSACGVSGKSIGLLLARKLVAYVEGRLIEKQTEDANLRTIVLLLPTSGLE